MTNNNMRALPVLLILITTIFSCKSPDERFRGGVIRDSGVFKFNDKLIIEINISNALVHYTVKDFNEKLKIETIHPFSDYQAWAFYLEDNGTFWVISSDIGYSYFSPTEKGQYSYHELPRNDVFGKIPKSLLQDLPEFFD